ncbi:ATP-binding cassette domain-containing protein [Actinokineospora soli]|uniref:ATP-binding cassette domain-containing protein n=1 Tax=Actinokineospora soli TaxID=1048753 RepID=A0ABW2TM64_9PSEU
MSVEIEDLTLRYGATTVLSGFHLSVRAGETVVVAGASGCGKSTLLRAVAGLLPVSGGRVVVDGEPVSGPSAQRALVFQDDGLLPWRTARRNVELPLALRGVRKGSGASAPTPGWPGSGWRGRGTGCRGSCPAACASGCSSPGRWRRARAWC